MRDVLQTIPLAVGSNYVRREKECLKEGNKLVFTWASPEVTLFGLFQLFKGGDFAPVDYPSLSNKRIEVYSTCTDQRIRRSQIKPILRLAKY
jgi:hypothetical protein